MNKTCIVCNKEYDLSGFSKAPKNKDGHTNRCKLCLNAYQREWTKRNPDKRKKHVQKYKQNDFEHWNELRRIRELRYKQNNWSKIQAKNKILNERKRGRLKNGPCIICGSIRTHAHHCDYNKPLEVMFLCRDHHLAWHRVFIAEEKHEVVAGIVEVK